MHEATELDVYYVQHQSLRLDLEIVLRTFGAVVRGSGAY
jgi:lipopolysaccharide/colanic/teichoic acid biosynthesis glycosyltransferase